ncbi:CHAT domain-containing protein [Streptomyces sp. RY43-2]|uniref:CHAT domain-containing protein n=1 Tax=Streptomyces macrolidinus TaxID=2952607 RepID=A0ABT0ZEZ8_9ACTN|nr:CHAT domain-containing protein [Streptomyces macrolidinus]MCN9242154.1 CHAT domain-containing protein [Streptomyces macrolidinus]
MWHVVDGRERADVLEEHGTPPDGFEPGLCWVDCPGCGSPAPIEAPLLVLRPHASAPMLFATSVAELQQDATATATELVAQAAQAGAFRGTPFGGRVIQLPRRLLPHVLSRDVDRDLADPEAALRELTVHGPPTVANYQKFLQYVAENKEEARLGELLHVVTVTSPDRLAQLVRTHPEFTDDSRVRDAGAEELRTALGTPLEATLRVRQQLLEDLCGGRMPVRTAIDRYAASLGAFAHDLRAHLHTMYATVRATDDLSVIPLAREAFELAGQLGEGEMETELAARLGERLVVAVRTGLDADLSEALRVLEHALARLPEGGLQWAEVANNLAAAQHLRDDGDRLERWETARDLLARATALDRRAQPESWARIQTNYGLLLAERPGGDRMDLTLGIDHVNAGLAERSPERNPVDWAYSQLNLGLLLFRRAEPDDLAQAERCYRNALRHLRPDDDPVLWSQVRCNLADLLLSREPADPRGAREAATAVVEFDAARPGLLDTGRATWLLARAADLLDGPGSAESVRLRHAALAAAPPRVAPSLHLSIAREAVNSLAEYEDWDGAAEVASGMLSAVHALYDAQVTAAGRRSVLAQANGIARRAAFLLARAGHPDRAVEAIERGLACELSVMTGRDTVDLEALERVDPLLAQRYRRARERYRVLVAQAPAGPDDSTSAGPYGGTSAGPYGDTSAGPVLGAAAAERAVRQVVEEIRTIPGFESFLRTTELADIVRAAGGMPLAYLVNAPWGSYVLVIPRDADALAQPLVHAFFVPEVSSTSIVRLLTLDPDVESAGLLVVQQAGVLKRRRLLPAAVDRLRGLAPLLRPVARLLARDPRHEAVVVPTGLLGHVPLHAVPLGPETDGPETDVVRDGALDEVSHDALDGVLDDTGTLTLAPSAGVYAASRAAAARPPLPVPRLVAVTDPDGSLPGARSELAELRDLFAAQGETFHAIGSDATVGWLLDHLANASYLHLSCHGRAEFAGRGGSLALADGQLDLDTLVRRRLPYCRLVVASACQSGHYEIKEAPDEFVGLPGGFLQAGAACAITSLWQVNDMVTALLMTRLYELLAPAGPAPGEPPASALRRSRTWLRGLTWDGLARYTAAHPHLAALLGQYGPSARPTPDRDERPFASPVHWAGFTAWGV